MCRLMGLDKVPMGNSRCPEIRPTLFRPIRVASQDTAPGHVHLLACGLPLGVASALAKTMTPIPVGGKQPAHEPSYDSRSASVGCMRSPRSVGAAQASTQTHPATAAVSAIVSGMLPTSSATWFR